MCDLTTTPPELLIEIIKKMDAVSFARLLCSCRSIALLLLDRKSIRVKSNSVLSLKGGQISESGGECPLSLLSLSSLRFFSLSLFKIHGEISDESCRLLCSLLSSHSIRCRCLHSVGLSPSQISSLAEVLRPNSAIINLWHLDSQEEIQELNLQSVDNVLSMACDSLEWISCSLADLVQKYERVVLQARSREGFERKLNSLLLTWQKGNCFGKRLRASVDLFFPSERPDKEEMFRNILLKHIQVWHGGRVPLEPSSARLCVPHSEMFSRFILIQRPSDGQSLVVFENYEDASRFHGRRWMFIFCFAKDPCEFLEALGQFCFGFQPVDFSNAQFSEFGSDALFGIDGFMIN